MNAKPIVVSMVGRTSPLERLRIWQIEAGMHCSVLGTCLTLNDLHVIARRARYQVDPGTSAYKLHSWFVDMMVYANDLSKLIDKELEKRHRIPAEKVRRARTEEELEARWKEVAGRGEIAGAYWGAMSHPLCSTSLQWKLFGEIHMLSHLVGASRRSDLCRVHELESACASLEAELAQIKHDHRGVLKDRKKLEDGHALRGRELEWSERRLTNAQRRIAALESETFARDLEVRVKDLEQQLREAQGRLDDAEASLAETRTRLAEAQTAEAIAAGQVLELAAENEAVELELARSMIAPAVEPRPEDDAGVLLGKRILCVGGRSNLVPHYRAIVERRGGAFLHHDGGIEESLDAVTRALATVDAVVCPVDCVSHAASLKVKRACKHLAKHFIVLRSSGLSSFARGLQTLAVAR